MPPDRAPAALVEHPHVGEKHAILDNPVEIFDAPSRLDRPDHHLVQGRGVAHVELDRVDLAALNCVEPLVAGIMNGPVERVPINTKSG